MTATWWALQVLNGARNPTETLRVYTSSLVKGYVGNGLIGDSPLMMDVLGGDTTPRDYALYLESSTKTSTVGCTEVSLFDSGIYSYDFLSQSYEAMVASTKYNVTTLANLELVLVVVDCSFSQLKAGDPSEVRNLLRGALEKRPSDLYLATLSLSVQEYEQRDHNKQGPAVLGMLTLIHDMQDKDVTQYYMMALAYPYQRSRYTKWSAFVVA